MIPGEFRLLTDDIMINKGRNVHKIKVLNKGDRPVQIGSHYHFYEVNSQLSFDREQAFGMRLNIPAGTAVRFEPGDTKDVELVAFGGGRQVFGLNNKTNGALDRGEDC